MNMTQLTDGARIVFARGDGQFCADTVRGSPFIQCTLLQPYAPNSHDPAVVLTNHSWCYVSDIVRVLPRRVDHA